MPRLLHLSDLHLGRIAKDDVFGDYKNDIVPLEDRLARQGLLRESLRKLNSLLRKKGQKLDAIIVTGDLTLRSSKEGFELFQEFLDCLSDVRPPARSIIVVPGNHDVQWAAKTAQARYTNFLQFVRMKGYTTPLLEGIDLKNSRPSPKYLRRHYVLSPDKTWAILPVNSADYCGRVTPIAPIKEDLWARLPELLKAQDPTLKVDDISAVFRQLRLHDIPRISEKQFSAIEWIFDDLEKRGAKDALIVAAVHHHLLPVTADEEFKTFESITNLGRLRKVIRENRISVLLHGHKHQPYEYFDHIYELPQADINNVFRTLVISGATIGSRTYSAQRMCRLLELQGLPHAPLVKLTDVPARAPAENLSLVETRLFPVWQGAHSHCNNGATVNVIEGNSVDVVYDRAREVLAAKDDRLFDLVCCVTNAPSPPEIPANYPDIPNVATQERRQWFARRVSWWQKHQFLKLHPEYRLTHGNRIYSYGGKRLNQLGSVVAILKAHPTSSRAIVTLLMPDAGDLEVDAKFPCFCFVHFVMRERTPGTLALELMAYFRKQEMRFWWPINVAELAFLQTSVLNEVRAEILKVHKKKAVAGPITTVTAEARVHDNVPGILIPVLDYDFEEEPTKLWQMVYAVYRPSARSRKEQPAQWARLLDDLTPAYQSDSEGIPVPIQGVAYMAEAAEHLAQEGGAKVAKLGQMFRELERVNRKHYQRLFGDRSNGSRDSQFEHENWRSSVVAILNRMRSVVNSALGCSLPRVR